MPHVITQPCCNDASCVPVCPVNCIHPTPDEPGYREAEMLYIDPDVCIDCGACVDVCPVEAVVPDDELEGPALRYLDINALHYEHATYAEVAPEPVRPVAKVEENASPLRVAIVGSGPAACYAAEELLSRRDVEVAVTMFERLPTPWGLVRSGVAPDHLGTKAVSQQFDQTASRSGLTLHLNVEVGRDISHEELLDHHHAVIYAVGASADRALGIPGEDLPGSVAATDFVGWYNGHPDFAHLDFDLSCERAVVVGNGNVALDVARILVSDEDTLRRSDIAQHALDALSKSAVREVVVVGRRGPAQAAYTTPEVLALGHLPGVDVLALSDEAELDAVSRAALAAGADPMGGFKAELVAEFARRGVVPGNRAVALRFRLSPAAVLGSDRVTGVRFVRTRLEGAGHDGVRAALTDEVEDVECGLVLRAIGYRGRPVPGVPFDAVRGTIPNADGRVLDPETREVVPGVYTAGWIKRGPSGVIGTNKLCSAGTVDVLIEDLTRGLLAQPTGSADDLGRLVASRQPEALGLADWLVIDRHEIALGASTARPRTKLVDIRQMVDVALDHRRAVTHGVPT